MKVEPIMVETPKVVSRVVHELVVQKIEGEKKKEMFVIVGDKGTILTSKDGTSLDFKDFWNSSTTLWSYLLPKILPLY